MLWLADTRDVRDDHAMIGSMSISTVLLLLLQILSGCSNSSSAPPPVTGCTTMPSDIMCERVNGDCVTLHCVDQNWVCSPGEAIVVLTPGRCSNADAGSDAGEAS